MSGCVPQKDACLCWSCTKACGGCSWSKDLIPVEGWDADPNVHSDGEIYGYVIRFCPEYVEETKKNRSHSELKSAEGVMLLVEAVAKKMRDDYVTGHGPWDETKLPKKFRDVPFPEKRAICRRRNRELIEKWLRSKEGMQMLQLSNPDEVIEMLQDLAERHEQELIDMYR